MKKATPEQMARSVRGYAEDLYELDTGHKLTEAEAVQIQHEAYRVFICANVRKKNSAEITQQI